MTYPLGREEAEEIEEEEDLSRYLPSDGTFGNPGVPWVLPHWDRSGNTEARLASEAG